LSKGKDARWGLLLFLLLPESEILLFQSEVQFRPAKAASSNSRLHKQYPFPYIAFFFESSTAGRSLPLLHNSPHSSLYTLGILYHLHQATFRYLGTIRLFVSSQFDSLFPFDRASLYASLNTLRFCSLASKAFCYIRHWQWKAISMSWTRAYTMSASMAPSRRASSATTLFAWLSWRW
jgi:hypothetical protein